MHSGSRLTGILRRYSNRGPGHPNRPSPRQRRLCHRRQDCNAAPGDDRRHRQPAPGVYLVSRRPRQAQPGTGYRDLRHPRGRISRHGVRCGHLHGGPGAERAGALRPGQRCAAADNLPHEEDAHLQLSKRFIEREVATLSRPSSRGVPILAESVAPELSEEARPVVRVPPAPW